MDKARGSKLKFQSHHMAIIVISIIRCPNEDLELIITHLGDEIYDESVAG